MAGHSKWANIKHKKAAMDKKRGAVFTKVARLITVAARRGGGEPEMNPSLRLAIEKARGVNMPKDNIERAIKKGTGGEDGANFEELIYEGYAQGGVAVYVEALTDNRNRTTPEVRKIFEKGGGSLGEIGCVGWMFERKGVIIVPSDKSEDEWMELALEFGADDVQVGEGGAEMSTSPESFEEVLKAVRNAELETDTADIQYIPNNTVTVDVETAEKIFKLTEMLEEHDDVQNVTTNIEMTPEIEALLNEE